MPFSAGAADNATFVYSGRAIKIVYPCIFLLHFPTHHLLFGHFMLVLPHAPTTKTATTIYAAKRKRGKAFSLTIIALGFYNCA